MLAQTRMVLFALASCMLALAAACPKFESPAVSTQCTKQFTKCKLPDGPLGVCAEVNCAKGEAGPCFKCMSQH